MHNILNEDEKTGIPWQNTKQRQKRHKDLPADTKAGIRGKNAIN